MKIEKKNLIYSAIVVIFLVVLAFVISNINTKANQSSSETVEDYSVGDEEIKAKVKTALEKAKTYQTSMNMSSKAIYNQLISSVEGFTKSEAQYAIDNLDK